MKGSVMKVPGVNVPLARLGLLVAAAACLALALAVPAIAGPTPTASAAPAASPAGAPQSLAGHAQTATQGPGAAAQSTGDATSLASPTPSAESGNGMAGQRLTTAAAAADSGCTGPSLKSGAYHPGEPIPWLQGEGWPCFPDVLDPATGKPYPFGVTNNPTLPDLHGNALKPGDPQCAAPALPAPHNDGAGGYQVPVLIKISNGLVLGGFSDNAYRFSQFPFSAYGTITGWIVATVSLPSLHVNVDPSNVVICNGRFDYAFPAPSLDGFSDSTWASRAEKFYQGASQTGQAFQPIPGSLGGFTFPVRTPPVGLIVVLKNFLVDSVGAAVTGVTSAGRLNLGTSLSTPAEATFTNAATGVPNGSFCDFQVTSALGTGPKKVVTPKPVTGFAAGKPGVPAGGYTLGTPKPIPADMLQPTKPLSGAVEGGTATIGSNAFSMTYIQGSTLCLTGLASALYGYNSDSLTNTLGPQGSLNPWPGGAFSGVGQTPPINPGMADMSADLTIEKVGMPKLSNLPSGYGFD